MNVIMDIPSAANGAKIRSSAAPIRKHRLKGISGKSGVAEGARVPDKMW